MALALRQVGKSQEEAVAAVGVALRTIDEWEGTSISSFTNTCNPPDLRTKVPFYGDLFILFSGNNCPPYSIAVAPALISTVMVITL